MNLVLSDKPEIKGYTILWEKEKTRDMVGVSQYLHVKEGSFPTKPMIEYRKGMMKNRDLDVIKLRDKLFREEDERIYAVMDVFGDKDVTIDKFIELVSKEVGEVESNPILTTEQETESEPDDFDLRTPAEEDSILSWGDTLFKSSIGMKEESVATEDTEDADVVDDTEDSNKDEDIDVEYNKVFNEEYAEMVKVEEQGEAPTQDNYNYMDMLIKPDTSSKEDSEELEISDMFNPHVVGLQNVEGDRDQRVEARSSFLENLEESLIDFEESGYVGVDLLETYKDEEDFEPIAPPTLKEVGVGNMDKETKELIETISHNTSEILELLETHIQSINRKIEDNFTHALKVQNEKEQLQMSSSNILTGHITPKERDLIDNYKPNPQMLNYLKKMYKGEKMETNEVYKGLELVGGTGEVLEESSDGLLEFICKYFPFVFLEYKNEILNKMKGE